MGGTDDRIHIIKHFLGIITIAYIGIRHDTNGDTQMLDDTERSYSIVEATTPGIQFLQFLTVMRCLSRQSSIKNKGE